MFLHSWTGMSNNNELARHFETYRQDVLGFLNGRVSDPNLAEDLLQQTFLRLLQRANWAAVENPKAYVKTTARNVLADHYSLKSVKFTREGVEYVDERHSDDKYSPARLLKSQEQLELIGGALGTLSSTVRRAFILSRFFGHTHAEVGEMLGLSPRTVEKHVAKGFATTYRALNEPGKLNGKNHLDEGEM